MRIRSSHLYNSTRSVLLTLAVAFAIAVSAPAQRMITSQIDNARTGANLGETALTPRNVKAQQFGKLFTLNVMGDVYAQPLFLGGVDIPHKGRHDVIFIATEHDRVYAFDAYGKPSTPLWEVDLLKKNVDTLLARDVGCPFIYPELGITSTPVIDAESGTLYILARTKERQTMLSSAEYHQRLHALAVTTGKEKFGGPVDIHASVRGKGAGTFGKLKLDFDPLTENPRASLLLANGLVYMTWGSSCDIGPYHGWVMAYDAHSLQQKAVFNASPDADDSGFWASDTGPAADKDGNVFVATGNGSFDAASGGRDYGDTLLKLDGPGLKPHDYFTPFNAVELDRNDSDLGSGGPLLLPDQPGAHPHLAMIAGKAGTLYLVDRDRMGHYQSREDSHAVQTISAHGEAGIYGAMAYWNHSVYVLSDSSDNALRQFSVKDDKLLLKSTTGSNFPGLCATPAISANGAKDGVVWVLRSKGWNSPDAPAALFAFDAANVAHQLYNSEQNSTRDRPGLALRFNIPTIVNGHVYIGAKGEIDVYGLLTTANSRK